MTTEHTLTATNKKLGRFATEVATILMGKDTPAFAKNVVADVKVVVEGINELNLGEKKMVQKEYQTYSGYPGGRKVSRMEEVVAKKGNEELLKMAVYGMLPGNKLRKPRMKNLIIK